MKILITGAAGYAGSHIAPALRRAGHTVTGLTRDQNSAQARALAAAEVLLVTGDLSDPTSYRDPLREADAVVHLTMDYNDPAGSDRALFDELTNAHHHDGRHRHLLYTTGCSSYGKVDVPVLDETTPGNPEHALYFRFQLEAELADRGLPHTVLRPGFMYGGDARTSQTGRWFAEAAAGRATFFGDTAKAWTWVHVDDLARAYTTVIDRAQHPDGGVNGEIFCLGEETPSVALDVLTACARSTGYTAEIPARPISEAGFLDQAADQDEVMTSAKARHQLGWVPRHTGVLDGIGIYQSAWQAAQLATAPA